MLKRGIAAVFAMVVLGGAIASFVLDTTANNQILSDQQAAQPPAAQANSTTEPVASSGSSVAPTAIPPTATPLLTPTHTPLPQNYEPHPLSIDYLRQRTYEGSDLVIERTLQQRFNYNQYVASYDSDGLKIYGLLTIPIGEPPATGWPAIIFNHGYIPPDIYRTTERYEAYVDAFARAGYVVFKSDYRGHGSSDGPASSAYGSQDYTIDVLNALASVRRLPQVDVNRIGMWGHSMGGWITMRAMVVDPDIKAGVIWGGVVGSYDDLFEEWWGQRRSSSGWRGRLIAEYGDSNANPFLWESLSATSYLNDVSGPIQLHHARGDATVPYELSVIFDGYMQDAGQHSELLLYPGDDHNISRNLDLAFTLSVVFFDEYVKNIN